jgi:Ca2+-dependent lipid-binding protein
MCICGCLQTKVQYATLQPVWNETFVFHVTNEDFYISIDVWDSDQLSKYACLTLSWCFDSGGVLGWGACEW